MRPQPHRIKTSSRATLLAAACLLCGAPAPQAALLVRVYEVSVPVSDQAAAFVEALRMALVRATGRRDADSDPNFSPLLADASRYVQLYQPARSGGWHITLDGAALERAIVATGAGLWPRERPVTLVALPSSLGSQDAAILRRSLEEAATWRGLPIIVTSAATVGLPDGPLQPDTALIAARRQGADALLLAAGGSEGGDWTWTFVDAASSQLFAGGATSGIHGAADALARPALGLGQYPEMEIWVEIGGIRDLRDYVQVTRTLSAASGVTIVELAQAGADELVYRVVLRGSAATLGSSLAADARLVPQAGAGARLRFNYRP
jgi:hypothetical protein